jgi:glucose-6-phosphate 1-dehydrogenase
MDLDAFRQRVTEGIKLKSPGEQKLLEEFKERLHYVSGQYDVREDFERLRVVLDAVEGDKGSLRVFYLALPPAVFHSVSKQIKESVYDARFTHRIIVEKPFGRDLESSNTLSRQLGALFRENEVCFEP